MPCAQFEMLILFKCVYRPRRDLLNVTKKLYAQCTQEYTIV